MNHVTQSVNPTVGFVFVTYNEPQQLHLVCERLNVMFDHPPIAIHHDFSQSTLDASAFPTNVRIVKNWFRTGWGTIEVVQGLLAALSLLYEGSDPNFGNPDWVVSLSGTDYPIQTAETILAELRSTAYDGFFDSRAIKDPGGRFVDEKLGEFPFQQPRYHQFAFNRYVAIPILPYKLARRLGIPVEKYTLRWPWLTRRLTPFDDSLQCFAGDAWFTARREVARLFLTDDDRRRTLLKHYSLRSGPEESIYQTLLGNTPALNICPDNLRYTDWRGMYAHPRTLSREDFPRLLSSSSHFARKFPFDSMLFKELDAAVATKSMLADTPSRAVAAVSVIIPSYNCAHYLPKAIESALAQTYTDLDIIVVDDGSTDETSTVVAPYLSKITYIRQDNKGLPAARNRGIRASRSPFIALLDADDSWLPDKLARQMPLFSDPEVAIVYSDFSVQYADGAFTPSYLSERPLTSEGYIFNNYIRSRFLFPSTMVLRRKNMEHCKLFDEEMLACEDIELFARMCLRGKVALLNEPMMIRTEGLQNITSNKDKLSLYTIRALHKLLGNEQAMSRSNRNVVKRELSLNYWYRGYESFKNSRFTTARGELVSAFRYDPGHRLKALMLFIASFLPASILRRLENRWTAAQ